MKRMLHKVYIPRLQGGRPSVFVGQVHANCRGLARCAPHCSRRPRDVPRPLAPGASKPACTRRPSAKSASSHPRSCCSNKQSGPSARIDRKAELAIDNQRPTQNRPRLSCAHTLLALGRAVRPPCSPCRSPGTEWPRLCGSALSRAGALCTVQPTPMMWLQRPSR